jgi:hypothetical protein
LIEGDDIKDVGNVDVAFELVNVDSDKDNVVV